MQGELINETGTMTGGGGKPRGGRMCLGNAAPKGLDTRQAAAELADAETEFTVSKQVQDSLLQKLGMCVYCCLQLQVCA